MNRRTRRELIEHLRADADRICARFGLRYQAIEAERANVKRRYGICYSDGSIKIRLRHVTTGQPLKYSSLVNTLCHELAHLKYFDHSPRFQDFYQQMLAWARRQGIYRPGRAASQSGEDARNPCGTTRAPTQAPIQAPTRPPKQAPRPKPAPGPEQLSLF
jgi:hypothetical protein